MVKYNTKCYYVKIVTNTQNNTQNIRLQHFYKCLNINAF